MRTTGATEQRPILRAMLAMFYTQAVLEITRHPHLTNNLLIQWVIRLGCEFIQVTGSYQGSMSL